MKVVAGAIAQFTTDDIEEIEQAGKYTISDNVTIELSDVEIISSGIPGFSVATNNGVTVALDITINEGLKEEWLAREFVNRIQNLRKDIGLKVIDRITLEVEKNQAITTAINNNLDYICNETLANTLLFNDESNFEGKTIKLADNVHAKVKLIKT